MQKYPVSIACQRQSRVRCIDVYPIHNGFCVTVVNNEIQTGGLGATLCAVHGQRKGVPLRYHNGGVDKKTVWSYPAANRAGQRDVLHRKLLCQAVRAVYGAVVIAVRDLAQLSEKPRVKSWFIRPSLIQELKAFGAKMKIV